MALSLGNIIMEFLLYTILYNRAKNLILQVIQNSFIISIDCKKNPLYYLDNSFYN